MVPFIFIVWVNNAVKRMGQFCSKLTLESEVRGNAYVVRQPGQNAAIFSLVFTVSTDFCGFIDLDTIHTETLLRKRRCFVSVFFSSMRWLLHTKEILSKSLWETWWRRAPLLSIVPRRNHGLRAFYCVFGRLVHADLLKKKQTQMVCEILKLFFYTFLLRALWTHNKYLIKYRNTMY